MSIKKTVDKCSDQNYSQQSKSRKNPNVHQLTNEYTLVYPQNGKLFSHKKNATTWIHLEKIMQSEDNY